MKRSIEAPPSFKITDFEDKSLLIVDDDDPLRDRLSRAMEKKGFVVRNSKTVENAIKMVISAPPKFALVDLRLEDGNGLDVVKEINKAKKDSRIVMLTGYGNLPTAVAAVKSGAIDLKQPAFVRAIASARSSSTRNKKSSRESNAPAFRSSSIRPIDFCRSRLTLMRPTWISLFLPYQL